MAETTAAPHELLYKRQVSSARDFLPESRFEQWSALVANFGVKLTNTRAPSEVTGEYSSMLGQNGVFYDWRDSENIVFQNPDKSADSCIILHYSVQGHSEVVGPKKGQSFQMPPGSLSLHDTTQPITKQWSGGRDLYLMLPYESASHVLGGKLDGALSLDRHPLAPFLRSQMQLLASQAQHLDAQNVANVLDGLQQFALRTLANVGSQLDRVTPTEIGLYAAAKRWIELHYAEAITPALLANALLCSRSNLYRAFAEQDLTLMELVYETRLQAAQSQLERTRAKIEVIALECGFLSASHLSRDYKARFGLTPREWRASFQGD